MDSRDLDSDLRPQRELSLLRHDLAHGFESSEDVARPAKRSLGADVADLLNLATPMALSELARQLLLATDTVILANRYSGDLGAQQVAEVGTANLWIYVTDAPLIGGIYTLLTLCAEACGAQNFKLAGTWTQIMLLVTFCSCIPLFVARNLTGVILGLLPGMGQYAHGAGLWSRWIQISILFEYSYMVLKLYMASQGAVKIALLNDAAFVIVNGVLGYLFVFKLFSPGPDYDGTLVASALATAVTRFLLCGSYCLIVFVFGKYHEPTWEWNPQAAMQRARFHTLLKLAFPAAMGFFFEILQYQLVMYMAAFLGPDVMAATSIVMNLIYNNLLVLSIGLANATGLTVAQRLGAGDPEGAKQVSMVGIGLSVLMGLVLGGAIWLTGERIAAWGAPAGRARELVENICRWVLPVTVVVFLNYNTVFQILLKTGRTKWPCILLPVCTWCVGCPLAYLLGIHLNWELEGLWIGNSTGYSVALLIFIGMYVASDWKKLAQQSRKRAEVPETEIAGSTSSPAVQA